MDSPKRTAKELDLSPEFADQVAYYKAENEFGVLAPRGWHCFSTYGSNGSGLFASPEPINEKQLLTSDSKGFSGPAIQVSVSAGDTSGRFTVARTIARVFPDRMEFVRDVISEGIEPASSFPLDRSRQIRFSVAGRMSWSLVANSSIPGLLAAR